MYGTVDLPKVKMYWIDTVYTSGCVGKRVRPMKGMTHRVTNNLIPVDWRMMWIKSTAPVKSNSRSTVKSST